MDEYVLQKYLIDSGFLSICLEQVKTKFSNDVIEKEKKLKSMLSKKQMKEVLRYRFDLERHLFTIRDKECFNMLYLGVKFGMEINEFCHQEMEEKSTE